MASNLNVWLTDWKKTGVNVQVPQYSVQVRLQFTKSDGEFVDRTETLKFPNVLSTFTAAELKEILERIIVDEARERLGVDA